MSIAEVLACVRDSYASRRSYDDEGTIADIVGGERVHVGSFRTSFVRTPFALELDFDTVYGERFSLRSGSGSTHEVRIATYKTFQMSRLDAAIATLTGITFGVAHIVPRLLLPDEVSGRSILDGYVERGSRNDPSPPGDRIDVEIGRSTVRVLSHPPWTISAVRERAQPLPERVRAHMDARRAVFPGSFSLPETIITYEHPTTGVSDEARICAICGRQDVELCALEDGIVCVPCVLDASRLVQSNPDSALRELWGYTLRPEVDAEMGSIVERAWQTDFPLGALEACLPGLMEMGLHAEAIRIAADAVCRGDQSAPRRMAAFLHLTRPMRSVLAAKLSDRPDRRR